MLGYPFLNSDYFLGPFFFLSSIRCWVMASGDAGGLGQLTAAELEFIAEDQLIEIVPKFKHGPLHLIQGDFGPFVPQARAKVPLWLAITLKKRQK